MNTFRREILRKCAQVGYAFVLLGYMAIRTTINERTALLLLTAFLLIYVKLEYIRVEWKGFRDVSTAFIRPRERHHFSSGTLQILASIVCLAVFPYKIAMASLFMMVFGDTVAGVLSLSKKSHRVLRRKTFEGALGELVTNTIIGVIFFPMHPLFGVFLATIATGVELFTLRLPDNLTVPLFTSFFGYIFSTLLP